MINILRPCRENTVFVNRDSCYTQLRPTFSHDIIFDIDCILELSASSNQQFVFRTINFALYAILNHCQIPCLPAIYHYNTAVNVYSVRAIQYKYYK